MIASFSGYLTVDSNCNSYVAAQAIEKISSAGTVTEYPNTATLVGSHGLTAIAADSGGNVYATNGLLNVVHKITPSIDADKRNERLGSRRDLIVRLQIEIIRRGHAIVDDAAVECSTPTHHRY